MCLREKTGQYIKNCKFYSGYEKIPNSIEDITCEQCIDNYILDYSKKNCINFTSEIAQGKSYYKSCKSLNIDNLTCKNCIEDTSTELLNGIFSEIIHFKNFFKLLKIIRKYMMII